MKEYFSNKTLLYVVAGLCLLGALWEFPICFLFDTGSLCVVFTVVLAVPGITLFYAGFLAFVYLVLFILPIVFSVMLIFNRRSAGFASIGIIVLSIILLPFCQAFGPIYGGLTALHRIALLLLTILLRRSRPGTPTTRSAIDINNL